MKKTSQSTETSPTSRSSGASAWLRREAWGLALLALAVLFGAVKLWPELTIGALPPNDLTLHLAASERLAQDLTRDEPLLDPWVSEWALGYPVWRSYQPLPHLVGAAWLALTRSLFADSFHAFAALHYLLMVLLPVSFWLGARLLGLSPPDAGLFALLSLAPSSAGDMGRYGLSYGATTWRGSGLFTQVVALHLLLPALGVVARALDGRGSRLAAGLLLALTSLAHIVFGYVGFVSAGLLALIGPRGGACRRLVRLLGIVVAALLLLAWFLVPLALSRHEINHSRWEDAVKWDSYGWTYLLREIGHGRLLDAWRWPALSLLLVAGVAFTLVRLFSRSSNDPDDGDTALPRRLLALAVLWLALYAGREAWGHLLLLAAMPGDLHIHRLQAAFEISVLLAGAYGLAEGLASLIRRRTPLASAGAAALAAALAAGVVYVGHERAHYLDENRDWGLENRRAWLGERADLEAALGEVQAILGEKPGRVSAGKAAEWGRDFKIGSMPLYSFTTRAHLDQVSFLYHSMSLTSDVMVHRNEEDLSHDVLFGVRAVLAPADRIFPPGFRLRAKHGRFAVYEASPEGYFGLVEVGSRYTGPTATHYEASKAFLESAQLRRGIVTSLDSTPRDVPTFGRWQPIPPAAPALLAPRGRIVKESKEAETYSATYDLLRPCWALIKITYHPDLAATVDGVPVHGIRVTPGFLAVPVPAGTHEVVVRYAPGPLRAALLFAGIAAFVLFGLALRRPPLRDFESALESRLAAITLPLTSARGRAALAVLALTLVAFRPLFRGRLVSGHDATEYPPRLVEFARAVGDGQIPPVWAPDLGSGHGQPLFEFAPPLVYAAALPLRAVGVKLADALQLGLYALHLLGALAIYRIPRRLGAERDVAVAVTALWCFVPYVSLDLFVRTAYAEAAAVAVSPVALWALLRALDGGGPRRVALAGVAIALVPLAHNAAALLLFPALVLVVIAQAFAAARTSRGQRLATGPLCLALGLGLSAFFWLPALLEKGLVKTDLLRQDFLHWGQHALVWWQLLWSRWGFGVSMPGTVGDGMSFALGPLHLLLALAGLWLAQRRQGDGRLRYLSWAFAAAALGGAFLSLGASGFLWEHIETLQYMAYPWRALSLPGLFLPLLALPVLARLSPARRWLAVALLVLVNLVHTEPKGYLTFDEEFYEPDSIASHEIKTSTREEYEPRWAEQPPRFSRDRLTAPGTALQVTVKSRRSAREVLLVDSPGAVRAETASLYYPGFAIAVNGKPVPIAPEPGRGTMRFDLPAGRSEVVIALGPTPVRRAASWLTLVTLLGLLVAVASSFKRGPATTR